MKRNPHSLFPINDNVFLRKESCCLLVCGKWGKSGSFIFGKVIFNLFSTGYTHFPRVYALIYKEVF